MKLTLSQKLCLFGSALLMVAQVTWAQEDFYQRHKEGWFWYHDPLVADELAETKPLEERVVQQPRPNSYRDTDISDYGLKEIWGMYPDDFQELLNHVHNLAVQEPSEENVLKYLVMQDVARRKALAYTNASMYATQKYGSLLSVNQVFPTSGPGVTARTQIQQEERERTIRSGRENHALLYFTSRTCRFCKKQDAILQFFIEKYQWQIKAVDINEQAGLAARFAIESTPTLLLIKRGEQRSMPVAVGVVSLTELERKLFRAIRYLAGETDDDSFLIYDFQKGSALDPTSILTHERRTPWPK